MLNFDSLPKSKDDIGGANPGLLENGTYRAKVKNPVMKTGKSGGAYLAVELHIQRPNGTNAIIYDNFFDSDKPLVQFKLAQFLRASNCIIQGNFELKDLVKIIGEKDLNVAVKTEKNEGYAPRNVVNAFDDDIYSPVKGTAAAKRAAAEPADPECPFTVGEEEY